MTVLVIDDDPGILTVFRATLSRDAKVNVLTAINLKEGLQKMKSIPPPDVVFLDLLFVPTGDSPGSSGEETLTHIVEFQRHNPDLIVIAMSGTADERLQKLAISMADVFKQKPFGAQRELIQAIKDGYEAKKRDGARPYEASLEMMELFDKLEASQTSP